MKKTIVAGAVALLALSPIPATAQLSSGSSFPGSSSAPSYTPHSPGDRYRVADQGDRIWGTIQDENGEVSTCTIGYVNKSEREVWTSEHCFEPEEEVRVDGVVVGKVTEGGGYGTTGNRRDDWAIITLSPGAAVGVNDYSTDKIDPSPRTGDSIQIYGAKTKTVFSTKITESAGGRIAFCPAETERGDSGGPVWSEDGLVGLFSGWGGNPPCGPTRTGYATPPTFAN